MMNKEIISKKYEIFVYTNKHLEDIKNKAKTLNILIKQLNNGDTSKYTVKIRYVIEISGKFKNLKILKHFIKNISQHFEEITDN